MQIVARIYVGHKIVTEDETFEVIDNIKKRSGYKYICRRQNGQTCTLDRQDVIQAQKEGHTFVTA
jgi:hypothetical protein